MAGWKLDTGCEAGTNEVVSSLAVQADGKILVGGDFTTLGGQSRIGIGRLNADGTLDTSFNPGTDGVVESTAAQEAERIVVGGGLTTLGGQRRNNIVRRFAGVRLVTIINTAGADYEP